MLTQEGLERICGRDIRTPLRQGSGINKHPICSECNFFDPYHPEASAQEKYDLRDIEKEPDNCCSYLCNCGKCPMDKEVHNKEQAFKFNEEQKQSIEFLIDKEASRGYILSCIEEFRGDDISEVFIEALNGLTEEQINEGITDMVAHGRLTEASPENEVFSGMIVVTKWMPNTAKAIRDENREVKLDPDRYERKRRELAEKKRLEKIEEDRVRAELEIRIKNRNKWRIEHSNKE